MSITKKNLAFTALAIATSFALNATDSLAEKNDGYNIKPVDAFENPTETEARTITEIAALQSVLHQKRYTEIKARKLRNVHPKAHGCVDATFTIDPDIKEKYQVGIFSKKGKIFEKVKIRFSNATGIINSDVDDKTDPSKPPKSRSRGMAIQIPNFKGQVGKVIAVPGETGTQDFLMINQPVFAIKDAEDYLELTLNQLDKKIKNPVVKLLSTLDKEGKERKREGQIVTSVVTTPLTNPLESQYFSGAPFLFGKDHVMKFSAKPCQEPPPQSFPDDPSDDYLRQAMKKHLDPKKGKEACFDFLLQVPSIPLPYNKVKDEFGIEDATFEWIDKKSLLKSFIPNFSGDFPGKTKKKIPYEKVAKIIIPKQDFDTREQDEACEALELTPWHALKEHQPLGGINRLRNPIYSESAKGRKE